MNRQQALNLYGCHTLSTWNARSYEFAAILFTASAYPEGLRAPSLVGIANSLAAILFGSAVGRWIDRGDSRLRTLLATIFVNRIIVVVACFMWLLIVRTHSAELVDDLLDKTKTTPDTAILKGVLKEVAFAVLLILGLVESLSRKANLICIERSWVPVLAPPSVSHGRTLTHVNAVMGRIDMICKMVAPIAVSQFLAIVHARFAALIFALVNLISLGLEWYSAKQLYVSDAELAKPVESKRGSQDGLSSGFCHIKSNQPRPIAQIYAVAASYVESLLLYFRSDVWAPSLSMCITHASILSITGVTVVFFLDSGYSLQLITIAETFSALFELSSTFVTPFAIGRIGRKLGSEQHEDLPLTGAATEPGEDADGLDSQTTAQEETTNTAVAHTGLYGIALMVLILFPSIPGLLYLTSHLSYPITRKTTSSPSFTSHPFSSFVILSALAMSRLGRGVFSLTTQQLGQSRVPLEHRSSFAGVEVAFVSLMGLGHNIGTAVWSEPSSFGLLAAASWVSVSCSLFLYVWWMRSEGLPWAWWKASGRGTYHYLDGGT